MPVIKKLNGIRLLVECDECSASYIRTKYNHKLSLERFGCSLCVPCSKKGKRNHFFGKTHSEEVKELLAEKTRDNIKNGVIDWRTEGFLRGQKENNDTTPLERWRDSVPEEVRFQAHSNKGSKNGMWGVPSPMGSGNGWSGWYKGHFFRSLLELGFLMKVSGQVKSAETKEYKVQYFIDGEPHNYYPDFVVDGVVYEIKPKKLLETKVNKQKFAAAKEKFDAFIILTEDDVSKPSFALLQEKVCSGEVRFINRYKEKFDAFKNTTKGRGNDI